MDIELTRDFGYLLPAFISGVLVVVLLFQRKKSVGVKNFIGFLLSLIVWIVTLLAYYRIDTQPHLLFFGRLNFASAFFFAHFLLWFVFNFPDPYKTKRWVRPLEITSYLTSVLLVGVTIITDLIIKNEIANPDGTRETLFGTFYILFPLFFGIYVLGSIILLVRRYFTSKGYERLQISYLLLGIVVSVTLGTITNLVLPGLFGNFSLQEFGPLSTIILIGVTMYAIKTARLFDIRYVFSQSLSYLALLASTTIVVMLPRIYYVTVLNRSPEVMSSLELTVITFFVLAYPKLSNFIKRIVDKDLLKADYDTEEVLSQVGRVLGENLEINKLFKSLSAIFNKKVGIKGIALVLFIEEEKESRTEILASFKDTLNWDKKSTDWKTIIEKFDSTQTRDTLEVLIRNQSEQRRLNMSVLNILKETKTLAILPIKTKSKIVGALLLEGKVTDRPYNARDLNLLAILKPQLETAIMRSTLYQETQQFAQTLQEEVRRATKKLRRANKRLREIDSMKDDLISIAGHELRTPATVINNNLFLMSQHLDDKNKREMYLKRVKAGVRREVEMINTLLEAARFGKKTIALEIIELDLTEMTKTAIDELSYQAKDKNLLVEFIPPTNKAEIDKIQKAGFALKPHENFIDKPVLVETDKTRLREVIDNLITNAIKYTNQGSIKVWVTESPDEAGFFIKDTGIGIKKANQKDLFSKFSRVKNRGASGIVRPGGTGLGLYVAKEIVRMHAGEIGVESDGVPGEGSLFYFRIPKKFSGKKKQSKVAQGTSYSDVSKVKENIELDAGKTLSGNKEKPNGESVTVELNAEKSRKSAKKTKETSKSKS